MKVLIPYGGRDRRANYLSRDHVSAGRRARDAVMLFASVPSGSTWTVTPSRCASWCSSLLRSRMDSRIGFPQSYSRRARLGAVSAITCSLPGTRRPDTRVSALVRQKRGLAPRKVGGAFPWPVGPHSSPLWATTTEIGSIWSSTPRRAVLSGCIMYGRPLICRHWAKTKRRD